MLTEQLAFLRPYALAARSIVIVNHVVVSGNTSPARVRVIWGQTVLDSLQLSIPGDPAWGHV